MQNILQVGLHVCTCTNLWGGFKGGLKPHQRHLYHKWNKYTVFIKTSHQKGWKEGSLICTWSGIHVVRVNEQENPHVCPSDPDSDIEVIDSDIV